MKSEFDLLFCLSWAEYFMFVRGLPMQTDNAVLQSTPSSQSHAAEFNRYCEPTVPARAMAEASPHQSCPLVGSVRFRMSDL